MIPSEHIETESTEIITDPYITHFNNKSDVTDSTLQTSETATPHIKHL